MRNFNKLGIGVVVALALGGASVAMANPHHNGATSYYVDSVDLPVYYQAVTSPTYVVSKPAYCPRMAQANYNYEQAYSSNPQYGMYHGGHHRMHHGMHHGMYKGMPYYKQGQGYFPQGFGLNNQDYPCGHVRGFEHNHSQGSCFGQVAPMHNGFGPHGGIYNDILQQPEVKAEYDKLQSYKDQLFAKREVLKSYVRNGKAADKIEAVANEVSALKHKVRDTRISLHRVAEAALYKAQSPKPIPAQLPEPAQSVPATKLEPATPVNTQATQATQKTEPQNTHH